MPTIQMHYDGWLTLPAAARQKLGLGTGDRLELELVGDTVVLRHVVRNPGCGRHPVIGAMLPPAAG
jgi:AbrB family looped-hinge helix DNA binding protein